MTRLSMLISDVFSIVTITLCLILKVPQIIRLVKSNQAVGLSLKGLFLELASYTVTMMYNYTNHMALLSYMEYPILVAQEYILIGLAMYYKSYKPNSILMVLSLYLAISAAFAFNILDKYILTFLLPLTIPVGGISKIMQLTEIIMRKNANSVSITTWFLSLFTNVTRIYTVYMDSSNLILMLNFIISSILSGSVMFAAIYYQKLYKSEAKKS